MIDNLRYIRGGWLVRSQCWWYERCMPDNLHYIHGGWLVVQASYAQQFTLHTRYLVSCTPDNLLYKYGSHCQLDEQPGS